MCLQWKIPVISEIWRLWSLKPLVFTLILGSNDDKIFLKSINIIGAFQRQQENFERWQFQETRWRILFSLSPFVYLLFNIHWHYKSSPDIVIFAFWPERLQKSNARCEMIFFSKIAYSPLYIKHVLFLMSY